LADLTGLVQQSHGMRHLCHADARAIQSRIAIRRTHLLDALVLSRDADREVAEEEGSCDFRLNFGEKPIDCLIKCIFPEFSWTQASTLSLRALHRAAAVLRSAARRRVAPARAGVRAWQPGMAANNISNESKTWAHMRLLASPNGLRHLGLRAGFCAKRHPSADLAL